MTSTDQPIPRPSSSTPEATTPPGHVVRAPEGAGAPLRLEFERTVPATLEALWRTLTDSAETGRWIGTWSGDPASGEIDFVMTAEGATDPERVAVRECAAPAVLELDMPGPDRRWIVRVELADAGSGDTRVRVTQGLALDEMTVEIGAGWHYYLDRWIAATLGDPLPTDFDAYHPAISSRNYAPPA